MEYTLLMEFNKINDKIVDSNDIDYIIYYLINLDAFVI